MRISATATLQAGDITGILRTVAEGATQGVTTAGEQLQAAAQANAPVRTGALRDSITLDTQSDDGTATATVSPQVDYAPYVEFGTGKRGAESAEAGPGPYRPDWPGMTPHPYMRPAQDELSPQIPDIIAQNISL